MRRFGGKERWGEVRGVKEGETERRFKKKKRWQRDPKTGDDVNQDGSDGKLGTKNLCSSSGS